jgi:hypothetical protein
VNIKESRQNDPPAVWSWGKGVGLNLPALKEVDMSKERLSCLNQEHVTKSSLDIISEENVLL